MHFIDSHGHIYREYYEEDFDSVVGRALEAQVTKIMLPCVSSQSINDIFDAVGKYPQHLFAMIGLHPTDIPEDADAELALLKPYLTHPNVVGVGEIGMDLYHDTSTVEVQKRVFNRQLEWAVEYHLPVSLHIRSAYTKALEILRRFEGTGVTGILHCFSGGIQEAEWAVRHGFLLGIGGVVTFKNSKLQEIVKAVGLEHLALETDSPFLAPVPHRGERNESAYIPHINDFIAKSLGVTPETVSAATDRNAQCLFGLKL